MFLDQISQTDTGFCLLARDDLARRQWELQLAELAAKRSLSVWPSERLLTWSQWAADRWRRSLDSAASDAERSLLSPRQSHRLWQRVIEESDEGATLIDCARSATWARGARQRLLEHCEELPNAGSAGGHEAYAAFIRWNRRFDALLDEHGWIDPESLLYRLNRLNVRSIAEDIAVLDGTHAPQAGLRLVARMQSSGCRSLAITPDDQQAKTQALLLASPVHELERAAEWLAARLHANPTQRVALVLPDLDARHDEVYAVLADRVGADRVWMTHAPKLADIGILGAALDAIRLLTPGSSFTELSRWLRSPFFNASHTSRQAAAVKLELRLRRDSRASGDFRTAWQRFGLKALLETHLPEDAAQLAAAFARLPRRATPTAWTAAWQECLRTLGWLGQERTLPPAQQQAWDMAWAQFAELTPITGGIDANDAWRAIGTIFAASSLYEPPRLSGIQVLQSIRDIGPGFNAAWIAGATAENLPEPANQNPLLPWSLQNRLQLPDSTSSARLAAAQLDLRNLERRLPHIVFSAAVRIQDRPQTPSPLVTGWSAIQALSDHAKVEPQGPAARLGKRKWVAIDDSAPGFSGTTIPGGARILDLQARCPVKAFCAARLGAESLEPPLVGIDGRLRGLLVHRALEVLLDPTAADSPGDRMAIAIDLTVSEILRPGDARWTTLVDAERRRLTRLIEQLLALDAARAGFSVAALERRVDIEIDGSRLRCRIDRVDRLANGAIVIIDYKTGVTSTQDWFGPRLKDCQLPLYAQAEQAAGIAVVQLAADEVRFRSACLDAVELPGTSKHFSANEWQAQLDEWRAQIAVLIAEFRQGDTRVAAATVGDIADDAREYAGGTYAPLSRVGDLR